MAVKWIPSLVCSFEKLHYFKIKLDVLFQVVQDFTVERFSIARKRLSHILAPFEVNQEQGKLKKKNDQQRNYPKGTYLRTHRYMDQHAAGKALS